MTPASHSASQALDFIVAALIEAVGVHCDKHRAIVLIFILLWNRLHRIAARFQRLWALWYEGRLLAPRNPASRNPPAPRDPQPHPEPGPNDPQPKPTLPRQYGWLVKLVPPAEIFATILQHLLVDPDVTKFLTEVPL